MSDEKSPASLLVSVRIPNFQLPHCSQVFSKAPKKSPAYVVRALLYFASRKPLVVAQALALFAVYEQKGGR